MKIRGVFFDLYGTLLNYGDMESAWTAWFEALGEALSASGVAVSRDRLWKESKGLFAAPDPPCSADGLTVYERRLGLLFEQLDMRRDVPLIQRAATDTVTAWSRYVELDPEAEPVLRVLAQRFTLALVSNFDHPAALRSLLQQTGLSAFFGTIVISGEVGLKKPDPAILLLAAQEAGLKPEEIVYIGDTIEDMQAAHDAAMFGVLRENSSDKTSGSAHYELKNVGTSVCDVVAPIRGRVTIHALGELLTILSVECAPDTYGQ